MVIAKLLQREVAIFLLISVALFSFVRSRFLKGTLKDMEGNPLPDAFTSVNGNNKSNRTSTLADGSFSLQFFDFNDSPEATNIGFRRAKQLPNKLQERF